MLGLQFELPSYPVLKGVPVWLIAIVFIGAIWMLAYLFLRMLDQRQDTYLLERLRDRNSNGLSLGLALGVAGLTAMLLLYMPLWLGSYGPLIITCESVLVGLVALKLCQRLHNGSRFNSGIPASLKPVETEHLLDEICSKIERITDKTRRHALAEDVVHCLNNGTLAPGRMEYFGNRISDAMHSFESDSDWEGALIIADAIAQAPEPYGEIALAGSQISRTAAGMFISEKSIYLAQCAKPGVKTVPEQLGMLASRIQAELDGASPNRIEQLIQEMETVLTELSPQDYESMQAILLERSLGVAYHKLGQQEKGQELISRSTQRMLLGNAGGTVSVSIKGSEPVSFPVDDLLSKDD